MCPERLCARTHGLLVIRWGLVRSSCQRLPAPLLRRAGAGRLRFARFEPFVRLGGVIHSERAIDVRLDRALRQEVEEFSQIADDMPMVAEGRFTACSRRGRRVAVA